MRRLAAAFGAVCCAWLAACGSPIVGAECRQGFVVCDGQCVDPERDAEHCGGCGNDCGAYACNAGMCGPGLRDAGSDAGSDVGNEPSDAGELDGGNVRPPPMEGLGSSGFPLQPDGGFAFPDPMVTSGCGIGETECGDNCADQQRDRDNCGACGATCGVEQFCVAGVCQNACDAPLRLCAGQCVDVDADAQHCGGCGVACASGLCEAGACADVVSGHVIVIGHDYSAPLTRASRTMQQIAGNALFLANGAPVRALVYRGAAQPQSIAGVTSAINFVATSMGRAWRQTDVEADDVSERLLSADAFVIHAQRGASDAELNQLGQRWGLSMAQFLLRGGIIVLFETVSGGNSGTFQVLEPAGLFAADERQVTTGTMQVVAFGDGVARNTTQSYQSQATTVRFTGLPSGAGVVVVDAGGGAVVVHRVSMP